MGLIAYHGTSPENVTSIQKEGFRVGTYFAYRIEEARFWGSRVFTVQFEESGFRGRSDGWQFHLRDPLPPEAILWVSG